MTARRAAATLGRADDGVFWRLVGLRVLFLLFTACTILWAPLHTAIPVDRAYNGLTDLIFGTFDQWDSGNFLQIARHGYGSHTSVLPAFFPLYPLLVAGAHYVFGSYLVAGVVVSLVAAGAAAWALASIARIVLGEQGARDAVLYLALFPTAFVFTAVYSDGLFLALSAAAFLAAMQRRPWLAALAGGLAVGTRSVGLALLPALVYLLWPRTRSRWWQPLPALAALPAALGAYALYLHEHVGDALAFEHAQWFWDRSRPALGPISGLHQALSEGLHSADLILRHLPRGMAAPAGFDANYESAFLDVSHLVFLLIACALTVVAWRKLGVAFGLYSAATLVFVLSEPVKGFALQSLPRFMMDDFPIVLALAALTINRPGARTWTIATLAVLGAAAGIAFSRGTIWVA